MLEVFNEPGMSNYLVVYLRLITSGHLQKNYEFYQHFIEGHASVKDFCSHEVEPMYKESDHIHITAITEATGISVCINYLNRGDGEQVTKHNFPDHLEPKIFLLYRPGHYDVLYKNDSIWFARQAFVLFFRLPCSHFSPSPIVWNTKTSSPTSSVCTRISINLFYCDTRLNCEATWIKKFSIVCLSYYIAKKKNTRRKRWTWIVWKFVLFRHSQSKISRPFVMKILALFYRPLSL